MTVLYTKYLSEWFMHSGVYIALYALIYLLSVTISIALFVLLLTDGEYLKFKGKCLMIFLIILGLCITVFLSLRAHKEMTTDTNYVKEKGVIFEDNKIDKDLIMDYKVKEVNGDLVIIEPLELNIVIVL